jgi:ATP-binding cassette subfamily B protein/ATP-binding cassette subfamily C protein
VVTPLVASRFIDLATSGADLSALFELAGASLGLALAGQALAVAETYVAEQVSWRICWPICCGWTRHFTPRIRRAS